MNWLSLVICNPKLVALAMLMRIALSLAALGHRISKFCMTHIRKDYL